MIQGFLKKAAPRFELGIKDLQSSALPLGHAAMSSTKNTLMDRISQTNKNVLVLSNGHGEDLIALRILEALHHLRPELRLEVLPLVGEGRAFASAIQQQWLFKRGIAQRLPSGGFSNQSARGLIADISAGLLCVTVKNWFCVQRAAKKGTVIIAVGDLLPLFFAWSSGGVYGFVGTPKSDYTWLTSKGRLLSDYYHFLKGTEWEPWEWYLMRTSRCKIVAVRDKITARGLRRKLVRAVAPGNPMMDGFELMDCPPSLKQSRRLLLLCGSRMPEALTNFRRLLDAAEKIPIQPFLTILVAIGSEPSLIEIEECLIRLGYRKQVYFTQEFFADSVFEKGKARIFIGVGQFSKWASLAEVGIANAGTATEQLVGLGVPCVSLPGRGPQFKDKFALRQSRLLGGSVIPCKSSEKMAEIVDFLFSDNQFRESLASQGRKRMGCKGGSQALAQMILNSFFEQ